MLLQPFPLKYSISNKNGKEKKKENQKIAAYLLIWCPSLLSFFSGTCPLLYFSPSLGVYNGCKIEIMTLPGSSRTLRLWLLHILIHLDGVKISGNHVSSCINLHLSSENSTADYKHYSLQHLYEVRKWVTLLPPLESCRSWVTKGSQRPVQGHVSSI